MYVYLRLRLLQPSALLLVVDTVSMLVNPRMTDGDVIDGGGDEGESKNTI